MPAHPSTSSSTFPPRFAAQHYNSALSIWLSVDPMSDKYPRVSPYTYCADNLVRLVDEDGRDIWELDECGNIINHIEDDMVDQFRIVDDKGEKSYIYTRDKGYTEYNQDTYYKPLKIRCPSSLQR